MSGYSSSVNSVVFSADGKILASGSEDKTIKLWNAATGREIRTLSGHPGEVNSVTFNADGKTIASGSGDSTTRIWDISSGKEIAQFISFTDGEWVCITPDGYYNASPNGDQYLNVRVDNRVYGIDQYRAAFYNPALVEARLSGNTDARLANTTTSIQNAAEPPLVKILRPNNGSAFPAGQVDLSVLVADQRDPIKKIEILVNGRMVGGDAISNLTGSPGLMKDYRGLQVTGNEKRVEFSFPISLDPGPNHIEVLASNSYSEGRDTVDVIRRQAALEANILPNLWILSIGINRYNDARLSNLNYAVNDAREIIDVFKAQEGKLYRKVNSLLIADGAAIAPTTENIIDNFGYLKNAAQGDVVMLFIAGHGINDEGRNFYFMPSDAVFSPDGTFRPSRAISSEQIKAVLKVRGQKLVFIDACHSEGFTGTKARGVENNRLVNDLKDQSTVIFTASQGDEVSLEDPKFRHGLFTYAIIQGMKGAADMAIGDFGKDGKVSMKELDAYVSEMVPSLSKGFQHPTTYTPEGYINFPMAETR
ncbi:hypothetical protein FACS1894137_11690 [Spirochaetia bacterium]|nr:hypothetical protein FACS1894137_11690 [Spirochaetia bacterium]